MTFPPLPLSYFQPAVAEGREKRVNDLGSTDPATRTDDVPRPSGSIRRNLELGNREFVNEFSIPKFSIPKFLASSLPSQIRSGARLNANSR